MDEDLVPTSCQHLKDYGAFLNDVISQYLQYHVPWDATDKQRIVASFINDNGWMLRYIYCKYLCEGRKDCTLRDHVST
jgi:hypothetical protein